ncbi:hypothetical protein [Streptomyces sp. NPDC059552]|uniref:terpene synthase family protein n=1 Tax=Streptomyces sp. NPDC059552 TaxID=3346862 RepID=UPI0036A1BC07
MPFSDLSETELYVKFATLPKPDYPFPFQANPATEELVQEYYRWIDADYEFHSNKARALHKSHRLSDFPALSMPHLTLAELRPVARYAASGAMMDDYYDRCTPDEMDQIRLRIVALLVGEDGTEPAPGIDRQFYMLRKEAMACGMPDHLYANFIKAIDGVLIGYREEKRWVARNEPPPLAVYWVIRENTSGALPFAKYTCMQKNFRALPHVVLDDPMILRLHQLASRMVGIHNDLTSLPKELARDGDVINLVLCLQHEKKISTDDAYLMALELHNGFLEEFLTIRDNLPNFGQWQDIVIDYVDHLGIMVRGLYRYHEISTRYKAGSYVDPEYQSPEFTWIRP